MGNWTRTFFICLLAGLVKLKVLQAAGCALGGESCPGKAWDGEIWDEEPRLVELDRSGERYEVGREGDSLKILYVYGSPFELGRAHGILLRDDIHAMYAKLFTHIENEWISALHLTLLPDIVARTIARIALNAALDATYLLTLRYIPARFVDEMLGLSQGAEVDFQDVVRVQMIPELFQTSCSLLGSWGPATAGQGSLFQMRSLDWDITSPLLEFHTVLYLFPSDGNSFAIFTWAGFIGCVTGYSGQLGISEKNWMGSNATSSHWGMPWPFVLRDVLQFSDNLDTALKLMTKTPRTCPILVGIGSLEDEKLLLLGSSSDILQVLDDSNFTSVTSLTPDQNIFRGVIFVDKFPQPSEDICMGSIVGSHYGRLDVRALMDMVSMQQTGNLHTALYDFAGNNVYFSWAVRDNTTGDIIPAYGRDFVKLNMSSLFNLEPSCSLTEDGFEYCSRDQRVRHWKLL